LNDRKGRENEYTNKGQRKGNFFHRAAKRAFVVGMG